MAFQSSSKPPPGNLSRFLHGDPALSAHRDLGQPRAGTSSQLESQFRQQGSSPSTGTDDDFGRFAQAGSSSQSWTEQGSYPAGGSSSGYSTYPHQTQLDSRSSQGQVDDSDSNAIQSLLSSTTLTDSISSEWQSELLATQSTPWRSHTESSLPLDPIAAHNPHTAGKGKGKSINHAATPGDVSPVTSQLLASLSSLELADRTYLRSLLAQSPEHAVSDYFAGATYADDVWGVANPHPAVGEILSRVVEGGVDSAGRQEKAVRRLAMVAQHLGPGATSTARGRIEAKDTEAQQDDAVMETSKPSWAAEYPQITQPLRSRTAQRPLESTAYPPQDSHRAGMQTRSFAQCYQQTPATQSSVQSPSFARPVVQQALARGIPEQADERMDEDAKEEEPERPLTPFSHFLEERLRAMAAGQDGWMGRYGGRF